jgi:hypothetical protein
MREARLRHNLEKCIFRITKGKVLGCLVSMKGIKANPDKIIAHSNATFVEHERCPKAHRPNSIIELVCIEAGKT